MPPLVNFFLRYARQILLLLLLLLLGVLANSRLAPPTSEGNSQLQTLGNLALPYLISGDRNGLRQTLDLVIQGSPVVEASVMNIENQRQVQVFNRNTAGLDVENATAHVRQLVLEQSLLGTLAITVALPRAQVPWLALGLGLLALLAATTLLMRPGIANASPAATEPTVRPRLLLAISLNPLVASLRAGSGQADDQARWQQIVRQLAPNYGVEFLTLNDDMLFLCSRGEAAQSLRQACVFAWNLCQVLGADRGLAISAAVIPAKVARDALVGSLNLLEQDVLSQCEEMLVYSSAGSVVLPENLAKLLPREWSLQPVADLYSQVNELPASLCNLWRRQLEQLAQKHPD